MHCDLLWEKANLIASPRHMRKKRFQFESLKPRAQSIFTGAELYRPVVYIHIATVIPNKAFVVSFATVTLLVT